MRQHLKRFVLICILVLSVSTGFTFADWSLDVWHGTDWISDGETIDSDKIAENFNYLLGLSGANCTAHNSGEVRIEEGIMEYCNGEVWEIVPLYQWAVGEWGTCTASGQVRSVNCVDDTGAAVDSSNCTTTPPNTTQSCTLPTFNGWSGTWQNGGLSSNFRPSTYRLSMRSARDSGTPYFNVSTGYESNGFDAVLNFVARAGNGGGAIYIYDQDNTMLYSRGISAWTWISSYSGTFTVPADTTSLRAYYQVSTIKRGHWNFIDFYLTIQ